MSFICNFDNRSTMAYRFSVYTKDDKDLIALKERVKKNNELVRTRSRKHGFVYGEILRIRLMSRGPRRIWAKQDFDHPSYYSGTFGQYDAYLPHRYAEYFDVYVDQDSDAEDVLRTELKTGMTRSMQQKKSRLEFEARMIEWEGKQRLREAA
jgi:hypothetical protein